MQAQTAQDAPPPLLVGCVNGDDTLGLFLGDAPVGLLLLFGVHAATPFSTRALRARYEAISEDDRGAYWVLTVYRNPPGNR
ncbi:hypothetical protein [Palleronia marisminoris]|nr:hypothetical protein [Palleronia marisminoris]